ncbi:hypothetical protein J437_LFUL001141 [Ladona fulva]|uniref:NR LBD domain-containing protein n=1 Tax=Ladona fulva TaxID=123851 RepID=A0A8K0JX57_LADFU|nr:hypothetical protein J437_LFUL001141 [Ladona fulva]
MPSFPSPRRREGDARVRIAVEFALSCSFPPHFCRSFARHRPNLGFKALPGHRRNVKGAFSRGRVDDQMKLLQHSWSDMLVLDHMHQRMHNNLPDEMALPNGQKFDLLCLGLLGVPSLADHFSDLIAQLEDLKFDVSDYICIKFLLLLNPEVRGLMNWKHVHDGHDQVQQALLDYTVTCYPQIQDKFTKLLMVLPEIHQLASRGEDHLYHKHCTGGAPTQTLLMEMLHAKRK